VHYNVNRKQPTPYLKIQKMMAGFPEKAQGIFSKRKLPRRREEKRKKTSVRKEEKRRIHPAEREV